MNVVNPFKDKLMAKTEINNTNEMWQESLDIPLSQ